MVDHRRPHPTRPRHLPSGTRQTRRPDRPPARGDAPAGRPQTRRRRVQAAWPRCCSPPPSWCWPSSIALPAALGGARVAVRRRSGLDAERLRHRRRTVRRAWHNYADIFAARPATGSWNAFWQHHLLHRHHRGPGDRHRPRHGAGHAPGVPRPGLSGASILVPWAVPTAISGLLWRWIFQPTASPTPCSAPRSCGPPRASTPRSPSSSPRSGRPPRSSGCWSSPACRSSPRRSTRRPGSTAPARGASSAHHAAAGQARPAGGRAVPHAGRAADVRPARSC